MPQVQPTAVSTTLFWSQPQIAVVRSLPFFGPQALLSGPYEGNKLPPDKLGKTAEFPETERVDMQIYHVLSAADKMHEGWLQGSEGGTRRNPVLSVGLNKGESSKRRAQRPVPAP